MHPETTVVAAGRPARDPRAPLNESIVLSAAFHSGPDDNYYLRQGSSDTIRAFESAIGELEAGGGGTGCTALAFGSGMAAIAAIAEGRPSGTVVVVPATGYSTMTAIFDAQQALGRMTVRRVDITDTDAVLAALAGAGLLWLETVTNPLMGVADLPVLIEAAHASGALVCVDATFSTPLIVRPLDFGADVVMHSATKYLSGHSDLLMGVLVTRDPELGGALLERRGLTGALPGALESYLALRGLRTLALRMERAQANTLELATRLASHAAISRVRYPGLPGDEWHARAARLHDGFGAMVSFEIAGGPEEAEAVCERVRLISHATSLGGVESLIERRARYPVDAANGSPANLVRMSVGIEHVEDLWADLEQALAG
jgi:cystathionine gamma-synthase